MPFVGARHRHFVSTLPETASVARMREALALAEQSIGLSDPNPRVGCVIVGAGGEVIGRGFTREAGGPHAEVVALRDAAARGASVRGAAVFASLEPCSHHGRTPPCADALVAAGVGRVVCAMEDPNPLVSGQGLARLRAAGIAVESGVLEAEARELNIGFVARMTRKRPWLRLKMAASLDGRTALSSGESRWITGEAARADGHAWRKRAGAVLTGIGTVLEDDPRLDVRLVPTARQPLRVVVDSRLDMAPSARILAPPGEVLVFTASADAARRGALEATGAELCLRPDGRGKVDLGAVLAELGERGVNELHVEAGEKLNASFLLAGLVDELLVYVAPSLIGPGRSLAALPPLAKLADHLRFAFVSATPLGDDLRLRLRPRTA